jgi:hypothetical protein
MVALAVSAAVAAALASFGTAAVTPAVASAAPRVTCAAAVANGDVTVAFVIDFSGAPGAPGNGIIEACVAVPSGDNDSEALLALAGDAGFAVPRYSSSGLLCAIGGIPARGCGQPVKGGYDYWAYWQGSPSGWTYANTGPAENQVSSSVVQGWRWENPGAANPTDPKPRGPTTPGPICHPGPPPPPPTSTTTGPPPSPGSGSVTTTTRSTVPVAGSVPPAATTAGGTEAATGSAPPPSAASPRRAAPATAARMATGHGTTSSTAGMTTGRGGATGVASRSNGQLAFSPARASSHGGAGPPWLVIVLAVLVVGGLGAAAAYRWRRTPLS